MEDRNAPQSDSAPSSSAARRAALWGLKGLTLLALVAGVALCAQWVQGASPRWGTYVTQLTLIGAAAAGLISAGYYRQREWVAPLRRLESAYTDVRDRNAPIDVLNAVGGQLRPAAMMVAELMRELRSQQTKVAELNHELRQRVAQRTEQLERRIGSLKRQSTTDTLTGLQNRRRLDDALPEMMDRCQQEGTDLCLLMIDVDYFKQLNDLKGHAAGDDFLKSVGQLMRGTLRAADEAFRIGGDEFLILLPGCNAATGGAFAERLAVLTEAFARTFKVPLPPKLSIGMSTLRSLAEPSVANMMAEADKALYAVKAGRAIKSRAS
ncbi:MAG TPA: GGDEF domain-containing protein [Tepidisphaeraceae bacterium]|nr:GGDEF domain-containing protein [Tepidisphaeraceae bacterium]